jgi:hypothetical protein
MFRSKLTPVRSLNQNIGIACSLVLAASGSARADGTNTDTNTNTNTAPAASAKATASAAQDSARFSDQPAPLDLATFPERPAPIIELGDKFLGNGNLQKGITLPTGEVISPSLWVFGQFRTAVQTFDTGSGPGSRTTEWANRLDIFANLQLSGTERVVVGWRPLDRFNPNGSTDYAGYRIEPKSSDGPDSSFSATPRTLFFEGEFGEIFPTLDQHDKENFDYGFSVGRQPLTLQDGILANDNSVDMATITRNSMLIPGGSSLRLSGLFGWGQIERTDYTLASAPNAQDPGALLFGLDSTADFPISTIESDVLFESSSAYGDEFFAGIGALQRIGKLNTTFRANTSVAIDASGKKATSGTLFTAHLSYTLPENTDLVYLDTYWGIGRYSSAARDPSAGGPLGSIGILTASVALGQYGSPLSNQADHTAGGAVGYQMFFGELRRRQLVIEVGGRAPTHGSDLFREESVAGIGVRFQQAFGRRFIGILDTFGGVRDSNEAAVGGRVELLTKF